MVLLAGCGSAERAEAPEPVPAAPSAPSAFEEPPGAPGCVAAYRELPARLGLSRDPGRRAALLEQARGPAGPNEAPRSFQLLRDRVEQATGLDRLVGRASWTAGPARDRAGLELRELVATDPLLGTWPAARLAPRSPGPHPAILLLHGHGDTVEQALTVRFGATLAAEGFIVLAPSIRAYWDGDCEDEAAWTLLEAGLSLMAAHVAEASRAVQHLRADAAVDPARIYVIGHSGGGGIARLVPFAADVAGVVSDGPQAFGQLPADERIGDDFIPDLRSLGPALGREDSLGVPSAFHEVGPGGHAAALLERLDGWGARGSLLEASPPR